MSHYVDRTQNVVHMEPQNIESKLQVPKVSFNMDTSHLHTKLPETKGNFYIDSLLSRDEERTSPDTSRSRSISPSSTRSQSPPISPGSEEIPPSNFVPRPGLLNNIYPSGANFYSYQAQPASAFQSLDMAMVHNKLSYNFQANIHQRQIQLVASDWLRNSGSVIYPRFPDLVGEYPMLSFGFRMLRVSQLLTVQCVLAQLFSNCRTNDNRKIWSSNSFLIYKLSIKQCW